MTNMRAISVNQGRLALAIMAAGGWLNPFGTKGGRALTFPKQRSAEESDRRIAAAEAKRAARRAKLADHHGRCQVFDTIDRSRQGIPSRRANRE